MASAKTMTAAAALGSEHQTTIFERLDSLARRAESHDPRAPATGLGFCVLALIGIGLLVQASHAATTLEPEAFLGVLRSQAAMRIAGIGVLLAAARVGPSGIRPCVPALIVILATFLVFVFVPVIGLSANGSHRWIRLGFVQFQPSELARIVVVLWIADRCARLGPLVRDARKGVAPILALALFFFALIAGETDIGGAMLLLLCVFATMWVGGARPTHVVGTFTTVAGTALLLAFSLVPYVRRRIEVFFGDKSNDQVTDSLAAIRDGDLFGVGLARGAARNEGVPYLESDFVFAQVGEELGLFGMLLVLGLFAGFLWYALRFVLSVQNRFEALAAFGLLVSVALQGMLHVQVVCGLAPPKGMTLPFVSHGGTSLIVSCLAVGLALGAARRSPGAVP